jgi:hypothetical protein
MARGGGQQSVRLRKNGSPCMRHRREKGLTELKEILAALLARRRGGVQVYGQPWRSGDANLGNNEAAGTRVPSESPAKYRGGRGAECRYSSLNMTVACGAD